MSAANRTPSPGRPIRALVLTRMWPTHERPHYGTFVKDFRSLMAELPYNTIGVYSYSKGINWRAIAVLVIAVRCAQVSPSGM